MAGLTPAEAQALVSRTLQAIINAPPKRTLALRRLFNSAASINAKLPVEILVQIFRLSASADGSRRSMFRLPAICHVWRILIQDTPVYWADCLSQFTNISPIGCNGKYWPSVIVHAVARSAPLRFKFCLYSDFLPALRTPTAEAHLSRMTAMYLDCNIRSEDPMRLFYHLHLPALESLELQVRCPFLPSPPADISAARFPRLRTLKTNCAGFPLAWVGAPLRMLRIGAGAEIDTPSIALWERCCFLQSIPKLFEVLRQCPGLEVLNLFGCLWDDAAAVARIARSPAPTLDSLKALNLASKPHVVRALLEYLPLPRGTSVAIWTNSTYHAFSECLPVTNRLEAVSLINQVELAICRPRAAHPHIVQGYVSDDSDPDHWSRIPRLAVSLSDRSTTWSNYGFDLLEFFQGFAPIFSQVAIIQLGLTICQPRYVQYLAQREAWAWLLRYFPRLTHLSLEASTSKEFFSALAQENVMPELLNLRITLDGAEDHGRSVEHEAMVSALELRASRGLRLVSFEYRQQVKRRRGELPSTLQGPYLDRLQAVVTKVTTPVPCYID